MTDAAERVKSFLAETSDIGLWVSSDVIARNTELPEPDVREALRDIGSGAEAVPGEALITERDTRHGEVYYKFEPARAKA